jgi:hypothetical protein
VERIRNQREGVDSGACATVSTRGMGCAVSSAIPTISSKKKNEVSMPSSIMILVDLESPMVALRSNTAPRWVLIDSTEGHEQLLPRYKDSMTPVESTHKRLKTKMDFIGGVDVSVCCMFLVACNSKKCGSYV